MQTLDENVDTLVAGLEAQRAGGGTAILLHPPPSSFSRRESRDGDGEGVSAEWQNSRRLLKHLLKAEGMSA